MNNAAPAALARSAAPAAALARSNRRKKRFLLVSTAALAVVAVAMGVSFLDSSGTAAVSISASSSTLVYPLTHGTDASLPLGATSGSPGPLTTTAFSGPTTLVGTGTCGAASLVAGGASTNPTCSSLTGNTLAGGSIVSPSWTPVAGSAGTVTTAGDLAIVDATSVPNYVTVNMYATNLAALAIDYSSFAFPINVYQTTCNSTGCSAWQETLTSPYYTYFTDTSGALTFNLAKGNYYDIVMEGTDHYMTNVTSSTMTPTDSPNFGSSGSPAAPNIGTTSSGIGGSFYTTQDASAGSLSPTFYFTATAS